MFYKFNQDTLEFQRVKPSTYIKRNCLKRIRVKSYLKKLGRKCLKLEKERKEQHIYYKI